MSGFFYEIPETMQYASADPNQEFVSPMSVNVNSLPHSLAMRSVAP